MTTSTQQLYNALTPEQIDAYLFMSPASPNPRGRLFGGQVLAQALNTASRTVPEERCAHSMHAYFLRSGDDRKPVIFYVEPLRDGGSFSTRHVVAKQNGKAILNASVSFKVAEEGLSHQPDAPDVPAPLTLPNDLERRREHGLAEAYADYDVFNAFDFRTVGPLPDEFEKGDSKTQGIWIKPTAPVSDSILMQQCLLAYLSDVRLMVSAMKPHGLKFWGENVQAASLDHALWFHRPFNFDDWLYYDQSGPVCADARGLNLGRLFDSSGQLIASAAQEGLMRAG